LKLENFNVLTIRKLRRPTEPSSTGEDMGLARFILTSGVGAEMNYSAIIPSCMGMGKPMKLFLSTFRCSFRRRHHWFSMNRARPISSPA